MENMVQYLEHLNSRDFTSESISWETLIVGYIKNLH